MQVEVDVKCMRNKFGGCGFVGLEILVSFKCPFWSMDHSPLWGQDLRALHVMHLD